MQTCIFVSNQYLNNQCYKTPRTKNLQLTSICQIKIISKSPAMQQEVLKRKISWHVCTAIQDKNFQ